eukprot:303463_1
MSINIIFSTIITFTRLASSVYTGEYVYHSTKQSWHNQRTYCDTYHNGLATIITQDDFNNANVIMTDAAVWIGLNDLSVEGVWQWSDGSRCIYDAGGHDCSDFWGTGEPNNSNGEDCAQVRLTTSWHINDQRCSDSLHALCNKRITSSPTSDPTTTPTTTPTTEPTSEPTIEPTSEPTTMPTTEPTTEPTTDPTHQPTSSPTLNKVDYFLDGKFCDNLNENTEIHYGGSLGECIDYCDAIGDECRMMNYFYYFKTNNDSRCYIFNDLCDIKDDTMYNNKSIIGYQTYNTECINYPYDWIDSVGDYCSY